MKKTKIKAILEETGGISIDLNFESSQHQAREILDAVAAVVKDSWTDGEIIVTEKNEEPIRRKTKESLDQTEIPLGKE